MITDPWEGGAKLERIMDEGIVTAFLDLKSEDWFLCYIKK